MIKEVKRMIFLQIAKKFWESIGAIPAIVVSTYLIGFLVLNTYLTYYGISETNVINYTSVKASIIFLAFNSVIFSLVFHSLNSSKESLNSFVTLTLSAFIGVFYGMLIFIFEKIFKFISKQKFDIMEIHSIEKIAFCFVVFIFIIFFFLQNPKKSTNTLTFYLIALLLLCVFTLIDGPPIIKITTAYCFTISVACLYVFNNIYKNYNSSIGDMLETVAAIIAFIFISCTLFGFLIYDKLPTQIGGGRPYYLRLYLSKVEIDSMLDSKVIDNIKVLENPVRVLYVSDKKYYVEMNGKIIIIDSESIKGILRNQ